MDDSEAITVVVFIATPSRVLKHPLDAGPMDCSWQVGVGANSVFTQFDRS
jgi:hypothetical protein